MNNTSLFPFISTHYLRNPHLSAARNLEIRHHVITHNKRTLCETDIANIRLKFTFLHYSSDDSFCIITFSEMKQEWRQVLPSSKILAWIRHLYNRFRFGYRYR